MPPITRQNPPPPPFVPLGIFPLASLPCELTLQIASYLTPREIYAVLLASPALSDVLYVFNARYTREQVIFEDRLLRFYTPLQYFCSRGVECVVRRLLEKGVDPNGLSSGDRKHEISPLLHAIGFRSAPIVSLLLQYGAIVHGHNIEGENTALHVAVGPPHTIPPRRLHDQAGYNNRARELPLIVQALLDAGAEVKRLNRTRHTPLQTACATANANMAIVKSLIAAGSDVACRGVLIPIFSSFGDGDIQLMHYAANAGNLEIIQMLLDSGVDVEVKTRDGMRALDLGILHMRREVVELLISAGADVSTVITDECDEPLLSPFELVGPAATWEQTKDWLYSRGWQPKWRSLSEWWVQGKGPGKTPRRPGQSKDFQRGR